MCMLGLEPEKFHEVLRCCQRVILNSSVSHLDLRMFLVLRLREYQPRAAAQIGQFTEEEITELRMRIAEALNAERMQLTW
jgi:hypothetical protein